MAFMLYFVGFVVFIAGVAAAATAMGLSDTLVTAAALGIIAIGFLAGFAHHRARGRGAAA